MNVLIITEEDVFYVYEFFRHFFSFRNRADYTVRAVTILAPFNKKSLWALAKQMYGFYGPARFLRMGALYAARKATGRSVTGIFRKYAIEPVPARSVNDADYIRAVKERNIDLIVSVAAPQIFKKEILAAPRYGCINSHSALLPENKGMMPVFWGMYKNAPEIGVTIHYMDENLDSGDIIVQQRVAVGDESLHAMILKTKLISATLVHETLHRIMRGTVEKIAMPPGGSYQTFPTPAEVKEFRRRGKRIM
jgi:methionyl-tRNA formyltransferase